MPEMPEIQFTTTLPQSKRGGGRLSSTNEYQQHMMNMPAPSRGKGRNAETEYAWFFVPAEVSETITDEAEREKAQRDNAQKLVNRFTSVGRRIRKNHGETHNYTFRKLRDPSNRDPNGDSYGDWGIVVFRVEADYPKGGPGSKKQQD